MTEQCPNIDCCKHSKNSEKRIWCESPNHYACVEYQTIKDIWIYDCEVFAHDWLVVFRNLAGGEEQYFTNDNYSLAQFIDNQYELVLGGYNTKHYDQWILKVIYNGAEPERVKELNDFIIAGNAGWNYGWLNHKKSPWINFDLMDDIAVPLRLKEIEGNLGMDIEESSVPFDIDRALTPEELEEVLRYCRYDVGATVRLFFERQGYIEAKIKLGAMRGLSVGQSIRLTNAKLTAEYLGARFYDRGDETTYEYPDNLVIEKYGEVMEFFRHIDKRYERKLNTDIAGVPHTIAWGGLHGALECYSETATDERVITHIDVTSYYPSLMIQNGYMSRSAPDPAEYREVYENRLQAKESGDKATADALKLVLNTTYGAMKNPYNQLYDPRMANAVCISGQLYLVDLIEKLETVDTLRLIQSNTDGLIVSYETVFEEGVKAIVAEWERRTGFTMGFTDVEKIVQKDVNNYVLRTVGGSVKVKGAYVSNYYGGDFQNKSLVIVAKAVVENLLNGADPAETINACGDPAQFQMICKAGRTYDSVVWACGEGEVEVQRTNRAYAVADKNCGTIYKVKLEKEGQKARRDKMANLPLHCVIANRGGISLNDIDKSFYIKMAQKRINDYLGIKPERKTRRTNIMATGTKTAARSAGLAGKLMALREAMNAFSWEKDGVNRHQKYEYITERQYKTNFKAALAEAGLDFKCSLVDCELHPAISDKQNMVMAKFEMSLIDRESGESEVYVVAGSGADMGDKGLYKACTGALKYFISTNYLVAEENDPESDAELLREEKPGYTPPERREEIKDKVTDQSGPATEEQIEAIGMGMEMLTEAKVDKAVIDAFTEMLESELTKEDAETILEGIGEALPEEDAA